LWHCLVVRAVPGHWFAQSMPDWLAAAILLAVSVAAAALSYYAVERPFLRLKPRWETKSGTPATIPRRQAA